MGADGRRRARDAHETGRARLVVDAFERFRYADGFSHARSLAYAVNLVLVQGLIALVGFAAAFGNLEVSRTIVDTIQTAMPGLAGELLTDAVKQAREVGSNDRYLALTLGLIGTADHRRDRARPDRAGAEPALRDRARPADAREVRTSVAPRGQRRLPVRRARSCCSPSGGTSAATAVRSTRSGSLSAGLSGSRSPASRSRACSSTHRAGTSRTSRGLPSAPGSASSSGRPSR